MWYTTRHLRHSTSPSVLSIADCAKLSTAFSQYFMKKITDIRNSINSVLCTTTTHSTQARPVDTLDRTFTGLPLSMFQTVTVAKVTKLVNSMPEKSSPLDFLFISL